MIQIEDPGRQGPIEHLMACHRRIEQRLTALERAGEALQAIENSLRFLETSGALHHVDEEESLFPRLRGSLTADELPYIERLQAEHREADALYASLKQCVSNLDVQQYKDIVARLVSVYRGHIASEDKILITLGRRVLTEDQLSDIQTEMQSRRRP